MSDDAKSIAERLAYLRGEIEAERISQGELVELEGLAEHIDPGDTLLLEWAGVLEFPEEEDGDRIASITGTITLSSGETVEFSIGSGWQQWGATREVLGKTSGALDAILRVLSEEGILSND